MNNIYDLPSLSLALIILYILTREAIIPLLRGNNKPNGTVDHLIKEVHEWLKPDNTGSQLWKGYHIKSKLDIIEKRIEEMEKNQSKMVDQMVRMTEVIDRQLRHNLNNRDGAVNKSTKENVA